MPTPENVRRMLKGLGASELLLDGFDQLVNSIEGGGRSAFAAPSGPGVDHEEYVLVEQDGWEYILDSAGRMFRLDSRATGEVHWCHRCDEPRATCCCG